MNKITYLFGAGASFHALPIVDEFSDRLDKLINLLEQEDMALDSEESFYTLAANNKESKRDSQLEFIESLRWMMEESKSSASIDTYAKKLYLKKDYNNYNKLKYVMSIFFTIEQVLNRPDYRYDAFFASLLDNLHELPKNITILSWNYDSQFELAYSEYIDEQNLSILQDRLRVQYKYLHYEDDDNFSIYKLNGTSGLKKRTDYSDFWFLENFKHEVNINFVEEIIGKFFHVTKSDMYNSALLFAWEYDESRTSIVSRVINKIKDSVALVVIGYSFPFFNRTVDRQILGSMENLKRIYLQDPEPQILKEKFQAIRPDITDDIIVQIEKCEQFYLPNEL